MALETGSLLGPYQIAGKLGEGGMGEVYRARDTRMGRDVAIKVISAAWSNDKERLQRFEQEVRTTSSLSHPNIVAVYDTGSHDGYPYVVTELLEGETLRQALREGPLPFRRAIRFAEQIALGLAAAHSGGVIHRDLKPENLFVTKDGRLKILDFGLAKAEAAERQLAAEGETRSVFTTQPGTVLGTAGYMSPEQVRGEPLDPRSDIFSFGAILYEMLTGRRAFEGDTAVETMTAVLRQDPPELSKIGQIAPAPIGDVVPRCLEKKPDDRYQSARDLAFTLQSSARSSSSQPAAQEKVTRRQLWPWAAGISAVGAVAGAYYLGRRGAATLKGEFQRVTYQRGYVTSARFSQDGQTIVYSATWNADPVRVFSTRRGSPEFRVLDLPPSHILSISSQGEMALLNAVPGNYHPMERVGTLSVAPLAGGSPRARIENVQSADWSPDGADLAVVIVHATHRLEYPLGKTLFETKGKVASPRISPDGKLVAFLDQPQAGDDAGRVAVVDRAGKLKQLTPMWRSCHGLAWSPRGDEILFTAAGESGGRQLRGVSPAGQMRLISYEADRLTLHDVLGGDCLITHETYRMGMLANQPGGASERDLSWLDGSYLCDLLPDGKTVVFSEGGASMKGKPSVYLRRLDSGLPVRLGEGVGGTISSDGKWVAAIEKSGGNVMSVIPTGAGNTLRHELKLARLSYLRWRPMSPYVIAAGLEKPHPWSTYQIHSQTGELRMIGRPGMELVGPLSHDGKLAVVRSKGNKCHVISLDTGEVLHDAPLKDENESVVCFARDGREILVSEYSGMPLPIWRLESRDAQAHALEESAAGRSRRDFQGGQSLRRAGVGSVRVQLREPDG